MTGRERMLRAYRHEAVDRTPIGEMYEIAPPTRETILGRRCGFAERMEMLRDAPWKTIVETEAQDIIYIAMKLGFDMIGVRPNIAPNFERPRPISKYKWETSRTIREYLPESNIERTIAKGSDASPSEEYVNKEVVSDPEPTFYVFRRVRELMREHGIELAIFSPVYSIPVAVLGERLEWFHSQPEKLRQYYDECTKYAISRSKKLVEMGAEIIGLGGDLACDKGPMISPRHYRGFIMLQIREQADAIHEMGALVNNTSDGDLWPIMDDFLIGTHVDGFGEIDKAAGMDLSRLKREYGERICFVGNLDIRWTFTKGTPEDCKKEMVKCIQDGWGKGGHVICTSNLVHKDVKPENYLAALDAYHEYFKC
jgi:uroporphyrinogen-III decarboxylase